MIEFSAAPFVGISDPGIERARQQAEVGIAGAALRRLRSEAKNRPPRIATGRIGDRRGWRGMSVILPSGEVGILICALGGFAAVSWTDPFSVQPNRIAYFRTSELVRFKAPAAVLLGSRKKGVAEKRSKKKAKAARLNGCCPPRPGSRPRGRPPKPSGISR